MSLQRNYYEVIGVTPTATTDDIKKKYRELARQFHPDVVKDKTLGQKVFTQINQAYRVLADPEKRSQYDTTLLTDKVRSGTGSSAAASSASGPAGASSRPGQAMAAGDSAAMQSSSQPLSAQQVTTVTRLMADAEGAMMQNKLGDVKTICDKVLQIDARNCKALALMGDALVQMGKPRDAASAYRIAQQIAPSALLQNKISRLEGASAAAALSMARSGTSKTGTIAETGSGEAQKIKPESVAEGKDKPASGLLSRLLGRK